MAYRYFEFMEAHLLQQHNYVVPSVLREELEEAVTQMDVMPSMRALKTAGKTLQQCHVAMYNCSYLPIDDPAAFHELLYVLLHGTGVGFSVEQECVGKLPSVATRFHESSAVVNADDSPLGMSQALQQLIARLYAGEVPQWDLTAMQPAGTPLPDIGAQAPGAGPLNGLFVYTVGLFRGAAGRQLSSLECHDLVCKIGEVVVGPGNRRAALISLSDLEDDAMRDCKSGEWWHANGHRALANISAVHESRPSPAAFQREWDALRASGSGERGIFSRAAVAAQAAANRGRATAGVRFGCNPCCEIIFRPFQFCNLSEVVVRADDSVADLERKVLLASTLATWQCTLTSWHEGDGGLRPIWRENTEAERLLGVSLTGVMDNSAMAGRQAGFDLPKALLRLKAVAIRQNEAVAAALGVPASAAITCIKPSGTVSQLVDAASGIHARHSPFYIRRVRCGNDDPVAAQLARAGVPCEPCVYFKTSKVLAFPIAAPANAVVRDDISALEQLELCLVYQRHWCEHKPSVTITVRDGEWQAVGDWVYAHFDELAGVSFLPYDLGSYVQTPYEAIPRDEYERLVASGPGAAKWSEPKAHALFANEE